MQRRAITVSGIVQGVGFRPFVFSLAERFTVAGFARNEGGRVLIEVEGDATRLDAFAAALVAEAPTLARIDTISAVVVPVEGATEFRIEKSRGSAAKDVFISPDIATCADCLRELFDPADRRFGYPFINCTNCGPRLTIITGAPYDRAQTTMASFSLCEACRAEYEDPSDRRFHAQPIACPVCGPELQLLRDTGEPRVTTDALHDFTAAISNGLIGAMKGLGGFHLVCDATNEQAVQRLRSRKHREEKPFAVMMSDVAAAAAHCNLGVAEEALLQSPAAPIVLLRRRQKESLAAAVAPRNPQLGVMLPYTPLHHLLMRAVECRPLVMTSGNRADEPIARDNEAALAQLRGIADVFLLHNRRVHVRCDDSVTRVVSGKELPIRRSRGYAPQPVRLPFELSAPILGVGGQLKGSFALARNRDAFLSHHLGDLNHHQACVAFERDITLYKDLFQFEPSSIAHDLHPDYASTHYARRTGLPLAPVQHHHAHMASCMAENGLTNEVIGVTFDGLGFGVDGAVWGGEFLVGNYCEFRRAAHFRYVGMPGGDQATREPWRMAVAHLCDAENRCAEFDTRFAAADLRVVRQMLERRFNTPMTSSVGRLFDAVASLAGVRDRVSYEGQAAMELEWLASELGECGVYPFEIETNSASLIVDTRPMIRAIVADGDGPRVVARRFHSTLGQIIRAVCERIRLQTKIGDVVLSGGVFMNTLLTSEVAEHLARDGFSVYRHRLVPPNDAGLSLGQVAIAAARLRMDAAAAIAT